MLPKWLVYSFVLSLLLFAPAMAQSEENKEAVEKRALDLLEEIAASSKSLRLPENRIYIQAETGQLLWQKDEKRARAIFKEVIVSFSDLLSRVDINNPKYPDLFNLINQQRMELLQNFSQLDAAMALDFLRSTRSALPPNPYLSDQQQEETEFQLEANLASQLAIRDPIKALEIAEEILSKDLSPQVISIIYQLQEKDREIASKLASEVIRKLISENLETNEKAIYIAYNLLNLYRSDQNGTGDKSKTPIISDRSYRELLERLATAALNVSSRSNPLDPAQLGNTRAILAQINPVLPDIEKYLPARAAALKARIEKLKINEQTYPGAGYQDLMANGSAEVLLDAAPKAPPELRDYFYQNAALKAATEGDADRARQILNDNISNPFRRNDMMKALNYQLLPRIIEERKPIEEALKMAQQFPSNEERAKILVQLAQAATANGDKDNALQFLNLAWTLVSSKAEDYNQLMTQIEIASAYSMLQPEQSFAIIEPVIDQINELIPAAATLDGFGDGPRHFKDGELLLQPNNIEGQINGLMPLVHSNFDRALSIADRLQRNEVRLMVKLLIVEGALRYSEKAAQ